MNPYLEQSDSWRGFHNGFLFCLQGVIAPQVVPNYVVKYEESIYIDQPEGDQRDLFAVADVSVAKQAAEERPGAAPATVSAAPVTATISIPKPVQKKRRWLTIRDKKKRTIITVIELLSPSDKRSGRDRERYLDKRNRILQSTANLIEIDLLRGGQRMPIPGLPTCDYCVMVSRRSERPRVGLWPIQLRDPLPAIPIPLRPGDAEPLVALKSVLNQVYDTGGFAYDAYGGSPEPPLSAADAEWARQLLAAASPQVEG
jgi:hypothetical protein